MAEAHVVASSHNIWDCMGQREKDTETDRQRQSETERQRDGKY